jgi:hypothetical protein
VDSPVVLLRRRAGAIAASIVRHAPPDSIAVIFAGGSVARGAVWGAAVANCLEIYSDIDLYVVIAAPEHAAGVRAAARAALRDLASSEPGVRYLRGADVGVYTREDLRAQPVRPGTADLAERHLPLYGDAGKIAMLVPQAGGRVDPAEALYLLENRAWDFDEPAATDPAVRRLQLVLSLKLDLDIATAHRIVAGVQARDLSDPAAPAGSGITSPPVAAAAARAIRARDDLAGFLAVAGSSEVEPPIVRACNAWRELAPHVLALPAADGATLVAARCSEGRWIENSRKNVQAARSAGRSRVQAIIGGVRCAGRSARATVRVHAIARALMRVEPAGSMRSHLTHLDHVTAALGFRDGTLDDRARAARHALL